MHCADIPSTMCNCASTTSKRHTTSKSANTHYTRIQTTSSAVNEFPIIVSFCPEGSPFCVGISDWLWSLGHIRHSFSHITHYSLLLTNSKKIRFMCARNKHRICSNNDNNRCRYNKKKHNKSHCILSCVPCEHDGRGQIIVITIICISMPDAFEGHTNTVHMAHGHSNFIVVWHMQQCRQRDVEGITGSITQQIDTGIIQLLYVTIRRWREKSFLSCFSTRKTRMRGNGMHAYIECALANRMLQRATAKVMLLWFQEKTRFSTKIRLILTAHTFLSSPIIFRQCHMALFRKLNIMIVAKRDDEQKLQSSNDTARTGRICSAALLRKKKTSDGWQHKITTKVHENSFCLCFLSKRNRPKISLCSQHHTVKLDAVWFNSMLVAAFFVVVVVVG